MSDHADRSDSIVFEAVRRGVAHLHRQPRLMADGHCHFCDEHVSPEVLFCDVDCRDDYERETAARRREKPDLAVAPR